MQLVIDEQEQEHIFVCLKAGKKDFAKAKKQLELLAQPTDHIEEALELNQRLGRIFNPKAEEEARAASRKKDPAQIDIEDQVRSHARRLERRMRTLNETDGVPEVAPAGDAPSDYDLQTKLAEGDCFVRTEDIVGWTSSERAAALDFARRGGAKGVPAGEGWPSGTPPHVALVALREHELDALIAAGPYFVLHDEPEDEEAEDSRYSVLHRDTKEVDTEFDNDIDADVRAARLNQGLMPEASMKDEALEKLKELGIGSGADSGDAGSNPADESSDGASSSNRPASGGQDTASSDDWTLPHSVRVSDDAAQAIKAAGEGDDELWDEDDDENEEAEAALDEAFDDTLAVVAAEAPKKSRGKKKGGA